MWQVKKVRILHVPRFIRASKRAGDHIFNMSFDAIFLPLPEEMSETLRCFLLEKTEEDELWDEYTKLTEANEPMTLFLKRFFSPIFNSLKAKFKLNKFDVYCYHDVTTHVENAVLSEKQLLLEFRCKATGKLFLDEWRQLVKKYIERGEGNYKRLLILLNKYYEPIILVHCTSARFLKEGLRGWKVRVDYTHHYWRPPLEQLLIYSMIHGVDGILEEDFEKAIRQQLDYLDFVLAEESIDAAHEKWARKAAKILVSKRNSSLALKKV